MSLTLANVTKPELVQFATSKPIPAPATDSIDGWELSNLGAVARALIAAATAREETRGAHNRRDFPDRSPDFERHIVLG